MSALFHQIQQVRPIHNLQTQVGIDLGGKQLADEVKKPLHVPWRS